jgi:hypothetical protein
MATIISGDDGIDKVQNSIITAAKLDGAQSGSAPIFAARAWVNFDGTGTFSPNPSTSQIRGSGNVSSITKNSTGNFTVNITTALPNTNYCVAASASRNADATSRAVVARPFSNAFTTRADGTTTSFAINIADCATTGAANRDSDDICAIVIG